MSDYAITPEDIKTYVVSFDVTDQWVSFRHPDFPASSASKAENRYNCSGETAYYLASGYDTAKAEVPNWGEREAYKVAPTQIHGFDLAAWSLANGCHESFLKSKSDGGHGLCQQIAKQVTGTYGLSGILYNSQPMHAAGATGYCLVVLPPSGQLVDDTFFVKDVNFGA